MSGDALSDALIAELEGMALLKYLTYSEMRIVLHAIPHLLAEIARLKGENEKLMEKLEFTGKKDESHAS